MKKIISILFLTILVASCKKEETLKSADYFINEDGWYTYEMTRTDLATGTKFTTESPYIILGEYGSGFKLKEDGVCHINYSDGSQPIEEGSLTKKWEMNGNSEIIFTSQISEELNATILEISSKFLWIKYKSAGDNWEYKLRKIE